MFKGFQKAELLNRKLDFFDCEEKIEKTIELD